VKETKSHKNKCMIPFKGGNWNGQINRKKNGGCQRLRRREHVELSSEYRDSVLKVKNIPET
jgi:hypothetical protein